MSKKLVFGVILCFCFESSALAVGCGDNELKVVESSSPRYKVGSCLREGTVFILKAKECVLLKHNNGSSEKKCGRYSDKKKIDKGLIGFIEALIERMGIIRHK